MFSLAAVGATGLSVPIRWLVPGLCTSVGHPTGRAARKGPPEGNTVNWLEIAAILVIGFVGSAEFASAALVHPAIRKLRPDDQLVFEKGLLKTFGRIMPGAMTAATVLAVSMAVATPSGWLITAAASLAVALLVTILGNVPINLETGRINEANATEEFIVMRRRWDAFQISRGTLQLLGFILVTVGVVGA